MKKFFVLFCERNLYRPQLFRSLDSIRKKRNIHPQLKSAQFTSQLEAEKYLYPKKIAYLMIQQKIANEEQKERNQQLPQIQEQQIKEEQFDFEKNLQAMTQEISMEEVTSKKIKSLYEEIFSCQGSKTFIKSTPKITVQSGIQYYGFFDGASKGNPGPSGAGYLLVNRSGNTIFKNSINLGIRTNNEAQFFSLVYLLLDCKQNRVSKLKIYGDSQLALNGITGKNYIESNKLKYLNALAKYLMRGFESIEFEHVPRQNNRVADKLSNDGVKKKYLGKIIEE